MARVQPLQPCALGKAARDIQGPLQLLREGPGWKNAGHATWAGSRTGGTGEDIGV